MTFADALRALGDLVDSGLCIRRALVAWPERVPGEIRSELQAIAQRVRLGAPIEVAVSPLLAHPDGRALAALLAMSTSYGGSPARLLRALASTVEHREQRAAQARAAASAAAASNRLLVILPSLALPVLALSGVPIADRLGLGVIGCGAGIALLGMRWVERLIPQPEIDPIAVRTAELLAVLLRAGADLRGALDAAARSLADDHLARARNLVRLGRPWPRALMASEDPGLTALGRLLQRATETGTAASEGLDRFVTAARAGVEIAFEGKTRAAPVRMVVPLVACGLPSFCLLVVVPMLRSVPGI